MVIALKGNYMGFWSVDISGNWRIIFRFEDGDPRGSTAAAWVRLQANYDLSRIDPDEVQVHPDFLVSV